MSEVIAGYKEMDARDIEWLHLLVGDWQVVSDLAFADLVLWLPLDDGTFVALAQCRPSTGATVHYDDIVGTKAPDTMIALLTAAIESGEVQQLPAPRWSGSYSVREEAIPVMHDGRVIAVVARQTNLGSGRAPSRLEATFLESADELQGMMARGEYPIPGAATGQRRGAPRVGDGLLQLNADGEVLYASPNALSCFHRLGILGPLVGQSLVEVTSGRIEYDSTVDEAMPLVLMGRAPWRTDIETRQAAVSVRAIPLSEHGMRNGAVLLCRERDLMTKDATIREIHHRVKNNLATVAALLRLQARRMDSPEAREALEEAMRRVGTISLVHETLAQTMDEAVQFDEMATKSLRMAVDVSSTSTRVNVVQHGSFGAIPAENASTLALVLTELVTNAVEHGFSDERPEGTVWLDVQRDGKALQVIVADDGVGLGVQEDDSTPEPGTRRTSGLGTQIVKTLVENELNGKIVWRDRPGGGTDAVVTAKLK
jgi:two-component system, sensor histidine kinase PdtaS